MGTSLLLIRSSGKALARWVKARTFRRKDQKLIRLGTPFQPIDIGLATRIPYLGTIMSFDAFETQTADLRIKQAKAAVARLSRVLFKKQGLGLQHRLRVYRTCIRSSISYGLAVIGTSPQALKRLTSLEAKHVRCISGNPRKEDGESAEVIFQRLHYTSISKFLADASQRRLAMLTSCRDTYPGLAEDIQWQNTSTPCRTLLPKSLSTPNSAAFSAHSVRGLLTACMRCAHTVHAHTKLALSGLTCRRAQPDKRLTSRSIVYMGFPLADIAGSSFANGAASRVISCQLVPCCMPGRLHQLQ